MGLENQIDVTDDIGTADAILVSNSEMKQNPWIRTVSRFHQVPVFVMKVSSIVFYLFEFCSFFFLSLYNQLLTDLNNAVKHNGKNGKGNSNDS